MSPKADGPSAILKGLLHSPPRRGPSIRRRSRGGAVQAALPFHGSHGKVGPCATLQLHGSGGKVGPCATLPLHGSGGKVGPCATLPLHGSGGKVGPCETWGTATAANP